MRSATSIPVPAPLKSAAERPSRAPARGKSAERPNSAAARRSREAFRFGSGRLCFAFTGTLGERGNAQPLERLRHPADLSRWAREAGVARSAKAGEQDLHAARELREAIYRAADAVRVGRHPAARDRRLVNAWALRPALAPQVDAGGRLRFGGEGTIAEVLALVARDAVDVLVGSGERLRACADPGCLGLFVDTTQPGNRRWCSMSTCGNRAKKAALRARRAAG